jgi:putative oxidoreductase
VTTPPNIDTARLVWPRLGGLYARGEVICYALLRAGFGLVILTHGIPKLFGLPHGSMTDPLGGATRLIETNLGLPYAPQLAIMITALETVGALALTAGLFTRLLAPMFAVQMLVICFALRANFAWIDRGYEFPLVLGLIALFLSFRGGGELSLDRWMRREL